MDPVSQATLGAIAALTVSRPGERGRAALIGAIAGAAPDIDVLIKSSEDPLLGLQYHRHFTHALVFAPVIGLLVAALAALVPKIRSAGFGRLALYGIVGALTHGLLDACTSYGTQLYWPFSGYRESWDVISIIDPLFTGPLLLALVLTFVLRSAFWARLGLIICLGYLGFGVFQRENAESWARELADQRGHTVERVSARPSFANQILWRTVYLSDGTYYVDAVSIFPGREPVHYEGGAVEDFSGEDAEILVGSDNVLAGDVARFRHFSQDFLYRWPSDPGIIGDLRYSVLPDSVKPLWGIRVDPTRPDEHVTMEYFREVGDGSVGRLWKMIGGKPLDDQ